LRVAAGIVALMIGLGCAGTDRRETATAEEYLDALETLNLDPASYASIQDYHDTIQDALVAGLAHFDNPDELEHLFWRCHAIADGRPTSSQDRLQWTDAHWESLNAILYRLVDLPTDHAAEVLVDLALDPSAGWDAGAALGAGDAVVRCGQRALPRLRERRADAPRAEPMIRLIEAGATTFF
jgi:hypothetical protein